MNDCVSRGGSETWTDPTVIANGDQAIESATAACGSEPNDYASDYESGLRFLIHCVYVLCYTWDNPEHNDHDFHIRNNDLLGGMVCLVVTDHYAHVNGIDLLTVQLSLADHIQFFHLSHAQHLLHL